MDATAWPILAPLERRILGVLIEKAKTTPEAYPLSLNALATGCNQKTNRDPVINADESDIEETLEKMMPRGLVIKITGGRVDRWRHNLYESWTQNKIELAVIAELLLRGPQTEGELRGRASRMDPIESLDALREVLRPLVERKLVVYLTPPRSRGTMLTHGFHEPGELARLISLHSAGVPLPEFSPPAANPTAPAPAPAVPSATHAEFAALKDEIDELRTQIRNLSLQLAQLQSALGVTPNG